VNPAPVLDYQPSGPTLPHSTKPQYFLSYAILGCIIPFVSLFMADRGFSRPQIGYVLAAASLGIVFTPVLVTLLADTAIAGRYLAAILFTCAGAFIAAIFPFHDFWPVLLLYTGHAFALSAMFPLQDGIHFAAQAQRKSLGLPEVPYHTVRVWGTLGYMLPSVLLYFALTPGRSMSPAFVCGIAFAAAGLLYALFLLPHTPPPPRDDAHSRLPTAAAARAIAQPHLLLFCATMFLVHVAAQAYYYGFPFHLTERCGIERRYVGLISNLGTACEFFFILGFPWFVRRLSLRRVMYVGALAMATRLVLLAVTDDAWVAVLAQVCHGPTVLVIHIAPPIFLNRHADDRYRNSIQGLYTMCFAGAGRAVGSLLAGRLAAVSLPTAFATAAAVCTTAVILFYFAFHENKRPGDTQSA
jgi:PPP family 3-phenylpropionic acid transporter